MMFGFPAQYFVTRLCRRRFDLGDDYSARREQPGRAPECADRVSADADVAVGEQNLFPTPFGGQRREKVSVNRGSTTITCQIDSGA
jgi:hypothetical protein